MKFTSVKVVKFEYGVNNERAPLICRQAFSWKRRHFVAMKISGRLFSLGPSRSGAMLCACVYVCDCACVCVFRSFWRFFE